MASRKPLVLVSGGVVQLPSGDTIPVAALAELLSTANSWAAGQGGKTVQLTDGANIALDLSAGNSFSVVLGGNRTLSAPIGLTPGSKKKQAFDIDVWQDGYGSRSLAVNFVYNKAPTLSTGYCVRDKLLGSVDYFEQGVVTMATGTPGVFTWANHPLISGMSCSFSTTGSMLTGVTAATEYYVDVIDVNTFYLTSNMNFSPLIGLSGSQSGVHTLTALGVTLTCLTGLN